MQYQELVLARRAAKEFGLSALISKSVEEAVELADALCHYRGTPEGVVEILKEMVDCSLMIDQLRISLNIQDTEFYSLRKDMWNKLADLLDNSSDGVIDSRI